MYLRAEANIRVTNAKQGSGESVGNFMVRYGDLRQTSTLMGNIAPDAESEATYFLLALDTNRHGEMVRTLQNEGRLPKTIGRAYELASTWIGNIKNPGGGASSEPCRTP